MAELPPRRSALASVYRAGRFGARPAAGPGVLLSERRGLAIAQLAADLADYGAVAERVERALRVALPGQPNRASAAGNLAALWAGPGRVLIVGPDRRDLEAELTNALAGMEVAITGLGHARTVIRLSGSRVRDLLAKGCSLDFHPRAFSAGAAMQGSYEKINVLLHALDDTPTVDLYVARGFAVSLWEHLVEGALEFGCSVTD
jgi:heterotetrameric sarcosine oxidase gamma subunit